MCLLCAAGLGRLPARRSRVLQLLALIEHPDALPADAGLRVGREILALIELGEAGRRCDAVPPSEPEIVEFS